MARILGYQFKMFDVNWFLDIRRGVVKACDTCLFDVEAEADLIFFVINISRKFVYASYNWYITLSKCFVLPCYFFIGTRVFFLESWSWEWPKFYFKTALLTWFVVKVLLPVSGCFQNFKSHVKNMPTRLRFDQNIFILLSLVWVEVQLGSDWLCNMYRLK